MSNDNFNAAFNRILKKKEAKKQKTEEKPDSFTLGNTEAGRALATGKSSLFDDAGVSRDHSSWNIREYKAKPGYVKGRGKLGGIRK